MKRNRNNIDLEKYSTEALLKLNSKIGDIVKKRRNDRNLENKEYLKVGMEVRYEGTDERLLDKTFLLLK